MTPCSNCNGFGIIEFIWTDLRCGVCDGFGVILNIIDRMPRGDFDIGGEA